MATIPALCISCGNTNKTQLIPAPELDLVPITAKEIMPDTKQVEDAVAGDFSFNLFKSFSKDKSICVSPFSMGAALGMVSDGAAGHTAEQMKGVLGKDFSAAPDISTVKVANSVWVDRSIPLNSQFTGDIQERYSSKIFNRDFGQSTTVREINNWCSDNTGGKIPSIIERIDASIKMMILNAVYFKDNWKEPFDRVDKEDFTGIDGTVTRTDMMHLISQLRYFRNDFFQIVELPYESGDISMVVLLPMPDVPFRSAVSSLNSLSWENWLNSMKVERVRLSIPRFKLESDIEATPVLKDMGMTLAFSDMADFSKMSSSPLALDFVKQKTYIDVNEKGTEAAAVTSIGIRTTSIAPSVTVDFTADRPFIYVIRSASTGDILFIGQVTAM